MFLLMLSDEDCGCSDSLICSSLSKVLLFSLVILSLVLIRKCKIFAWLSSLTMGLLSILFKSGKEELVTCEADWSCG